MKEKYGNPPFDELEYCVRCCMPETREGITFDEMGICSMCRAAEEKMHINWLERKEKLSQILSAAKKRASNYDCIVPISGGKDSVYQLHVLVKLYGMNVLAVTFSHNWFSEVGKYNLQNAIEKFNVDHIMFTPNRKLINKLAKKSLYKIGDSCWSCHAGVGSFPLWIAVKFKIPLLIWGEPASEHGMGTYFDPVIRYDKDFFIKASALFYAEQMTDDEISLGDLSMFKLPSDEEISELGLTGIHLGDFLFWDAERQTEFIKKVYSWKEDNMEGAYKKYKSAECIMAGVHDYSCFVKRGWGRGTEQASQDVRAGLMTREEGFRIAGEVDFKVPSKGLMYFLDNTGLSISDFYKACKDLSPQKAKNLSYLSGKHHGNI